MVYGLECRVFGNRVVFVSAVLRVYHHGFLRLVPKFFGGARPVHLACFRNPYYRGLNKNLYFFGGSLL